MRTSVITPYTAYLRVYEPVQAFPEPARARWRRYVSSGATLDRIAGSQAEHQQALAGLLATPPLLVPAHESTDAYGLIVDGSVLLCPVQTRLRCWRAIAEIRSELSWSITEAMLPPVVVEQAESDFERWRGDNPDEQPHILTNTWFVPVRWFVPFTQDERTVEFGADGQPRTLYFRTPMVEARRRVARALRVLDRTVADGPVIKGVIELGQWLESFHPHSWLELDYGGLVHLLDDDSMAGDRSAADVAEALAALAAQDARAAAASYTRLMERWRAVQALERAS